MSGQGGPVHPETEVNPSDIAVIGLAGRFPGSATAAEFWRNLLDGKDLATAFTDAELAAAGTEPGLLANPAFVKSGYPLAGAERFDAEFFGFSAQEALITDPQHRVFLEAAWHSLEDAGYDPARFPGLVGVFAACSMNTYLIENVQADPAFLEKTGLHQVMLGNDKDYLPMRVSYKLNLRGPSFNVQTACSSSLSALHQACQSLLLGECDMAIAGAASVHAPQARGYLHQKGMIFSADGRCRPFDADSSGTVFGSGVAAVVLKRLGEALAQGDTIHAVIKSVAANNDGGEKVGFMAPSMVGQAEAIEAAHAIAGIAADTITYVEAHGTATEIGDPIEVSALTRAFRKHTGRKGFCALGSVKSNVGHLDAASGMAGLFKVIHALKSGIIPATLHFRSPNPRIDFANSPFHVSDRALEWRPEAGPRRAGLSSFGVGGTNVHAVLEEAPAPRASGASPRPLRIVPLSAKTPTALAATATRLLGALEAGDPPDAADVAFTLGVGRKEMEYRTALAVPGLPELRSGLRAWKPDPAAAPSRMREVIFLFPGQGAGFPRLDPALYRDEAVFRTQVDLCCRHLSAKLGCDFSAILFPADPRSAAPDASLVQPALFVVEYALARLWMHWGIRPDGLIGHSLGEYVAACLAGVMSLEDALDLVAARGRLVSRIEGGAMTAVFLPPEELREFLAGGISLAARNAPRLTVLSGPEPEIEAVEARLQAREVPFRRLETRTAFHNPVLAAIVPEFRECLRKATFSPASIPLISNVTGARLDPGEAMDEEYWVRHLLGTVRFAAGVEELRGTPDRIYLEVGPGKVLSSLVKQGLEKSDQGLVFTSQGPGGPDGGHAFLQRTLASLWTLGQRVDWSAYYEGESRRRVSLPGYPFEGKSYWLPGPARRKPAAEDREPLETGFYRPTWTETSLPPPGREPAPADHRWLVFAGRDPLSGAVLAALAGQAAPHRIVRQGEPRPEDAGCESLVPGEEEGYHLLARRLEAEAFRPDVIVHLWSAPDGAGDPVRGILDAAFLAKAFGDRASAGRLRICLAGRGLFKVSEGDGVHPEAAAMLGPCLVIPQEYPRLRCLAIDLGLQPPRPDEAEVSARRILADALRDFPSTFLAYRGGRRYHLGFAPARERKAPLPPFRKDGAYLITGGLGNIGLEIAARLGAVPGPALVLTSATALPPREEWRARSAEGDRLGAKLRALIGLAEKGVDIVTVQADAADEAAMRALVAEITARHGALHGVFHCAGKVGSARDFLRDLTREKAEAYWSGKAGGARALERALEGSRPDFVALFSSNAAVLGGMGDAAYASANLFLDAMASAQEGGSTRWISINWDQWPAALPPREQDRWKGAGKDLQAHGLDAATAIGCLEACLSRFAESRIIVSRGDIRERAGKWVPGGEGTEPDRSAREAGKPGTGRPASAVVKEVWKRVLGEEPADPKSSFFDAGGDSLAAIKLVRDLGEALGIGIPVVALFESPSLEQFTAHVERLTGASAPARRAPDVGEPARPGPAAGSGPEAGRDRSAVVPGGIAVIGMAGRFPGARNVGEYWDNLMAGAESLTRFTEGELRAAGVPEALSSRPEYVGVRGILAGADDFDPEFFHCGAREAQLMDPQHRVFLECAWEALEDAGYDPGRYPGSIGVLAGSSPSSYLTHFVVPGGVLDSPEFYQAMIGNSPDSLATRVSYKLDLKGPSLSVQSFCSTSLVAVHEACRKLRAGECGLALAGGVSILTPQRTGYLYREGLFLAPDGKCRPFDRDAKGMVFSNGAGAVVLKRLEDAVADGDHVYAVIRGTAVNNDGARKAGFTAPSVAGQVEVLREALRDSGVDPESLAFLETHGTGTSLGDPIEVEALARVFGGGGSDCLLGSVKSNLGHLDRAAGVASLIKAVLCLRNGRIPPTLNFRTPNPRIPWERTRFRVNTAPEEWIPSAGPRRAGVGSLGFGGTNAYAILEEAPRRAAAPKVDGPQLVLLSARDPAGLAAQRRALAAHLGRETGTSLSDLAYTLRVGRKAFPCRAALVAESAGSLREALLAEAAEPSAGGKDAEPPGLVVLFPPLENPIRREDLQGCWSDEGFRADVEACLGLADAGRGSRAEGFALRYALHRMLLRSGVRPSSTLGFGTGAWAAACVQGRVTLREALEALSLEDAPAAPAAEGFPSPLPCDRTVTLQWGPGAIPSDGRTGNPGCRVVESLHLPIPEAAKDAAGPHALLNLLGRLWCLGIEPDWSRADLFPIGRRIPLPTYPFQRRNCSLALPAKPPALPAGLPEDPLTGILGGQVQAMSTLLERQLDLIGTLTAAYPDQPNPVASGRVAEMPPNTPYAATSQPKEPEHA